MGNRPLVLIVLRSESMEKDLRFDMLEMGFKEGRMSDKLGADFTFLPSVKAENPQVRRAHEGIQEMITEASASLQSVPGAALCFFVDYLGITTAKKREYHEGVPFITIVDREGALDVIPVFREVTPVLMEIFHKIEGILGTNMPRTPPIDVTTLAEVLGKSLLVLEKRQGAPAASPVTQ